MGNVFVSETDLVTSVSQHEESIRDNEFRSYVGDHEGTSYEYYYYTGLNGGYDANPGVEIEIDMKFRIRLDQTGGA